VAVTGGDYTFTDEDPKAFTREQVSVALDLNNEVVEELLPGEPPTPLDAAWAAHEAVPARTRRYAFRAWAPDGSLAGATSGRIDPEDTDNPDILGCSIAVRAGHRRHGIGSRLLAYAVAVARNEQRTRIIGNTYESMPPAAAFASAFGGESKSAEHVNHLPIAEVDRPLMEKWVGEGPGRAPDYELLMWTGAVPDEHLEPFLDLFLVMNDAPRDDYEMNDFTLTPAQWREHEEQLDAIKGEQWTVVARRTSDGALAGFHNVFWYPYAPTHVQVGATGVRPEHRGHALGKWLKATMTLRVMDERPDVADIRTGNADSNDAMLGINREMGYRPLLGATGWELDVDTVAQRLADRGIEIPPLAPHRR
jgi:GNAT superfamily N-acetyltransferase